MAFTCFDKNNDAFFGYFLALYSTFVFNFWLSVGFCNYDMFEAEKNSKKYCFSHFDKNNDAFFRRFLVLYYFYV